MNKSAKSVKKATALALVLVFIASAVGAVAFAAPLEDVKTSIGTTAETVIAPDIVIPHYPIDDFPDLLVLKGVAVKDSEIKSAVLISIDRDKPYFRNTYLLIDGKIHELDLVDYTYDADKKTAIVRLSSGSEKFDLVVKMHRVDYRDVITASGVFDGHILNMRLIGNAPVYKILPMLEEAKPAVEIADIQVPIVIENIAELIEAAE